MVLSNKKLKQKLRAEVAESLAASEPSQGAALQPQTFKTLLNSVTQKPRLSKREVRRAKLLSFDDSKPLEKGSGGFQTQDEDVGLGNEEKQRKNEKKKRKRADAEGGLGKEAGDGDGGLTVDKKAEKKKKKEKEKKKKKEKEKKKKSKEGSKNRSGESKEKGTSDSQKIGTSQENGNSATKVYVGGIPYYSTEDDIQSFFESCGTVTDVDCMMFPDSGKFRGIAILTFKTEAAAKRALALNGADMGGLLLKIKSYEVAQPQRPLSDFSPNIVDGYNRIYVGNLSWDITEEDLRKLFSDCQISAIRFGQDKTTGEFQGYAHVDFSDSLSLAIALKLDQQVVCGRPVRIRCAVPKKVPETLSTPGSSTGTKSTDDGAGTGNMNKNTESTGSTGSAKTKSRKCYECGLKGHLSSACPQKQVLNVENSGSGS